MSQTILILDDDRHVRESLAMHLSDDGFDVMEAESSEQALEMLGIHRVDMVIVDLRLPGLNGADFIHAAHGQWPRLRYLVYTGSPDFRIPEGLKSHPRIASTIFFKPQPELAQMTSVINKMLNP